MSKATAKRCSRIWAITLLAAAILQVGAAAAQASEDPLFVFTPVPESPQPLPPPSGYLEGPCGLAVDSAGSFYVSDYYHQAVDAFSSSRDYQGQLRELDPLDGPCALALDGADRLYLNDYHRNVTGFGSFGSFGGGTVLTGAPLDTSEPTGLAVNPSNGDLYVDQRTYIARYEAPVEPGEAPVAKIGLGSLVDGYGLALSQFPDTHGQLYVADAADREVKVYDPATDLENPVARISGFTSLRDSALAVDRISGEVYVADDLQPAHTEEPEARIDVYGPSGVNEGHLKYKVVDARPPGLAVDNSAGPTQGRVYVTSGNTSRSSVYAYLPGSATTADALPPLPPSSPGVGPESAAGPLAATAKGGCEAGCGQRRPDAGARSSAIAQQGNLRVTVSGRLSPHSLPRRGAAPIAVSVDGEVATTDGSLPPRLQALRIDLNRHGQLDYAGLPTCPYDRIHPASSSHALAVCRAALVGRGSFSANIELSGQQSYPTTGRLLLFNGKRGGKPVLYGQIYAPRPFATSFVIVFAVRRLERGAYGTALKAALPRALGGWGNLTGIEMTLSRRYIYRGERHSFLSAGCPAPKGFPGAVFPLARSSFDFGGGQKLTTTLASSCRVRE